MKYDIVIVNVPFVRRIPQTGPALLKASIEKSGFTCKVLDWNFDIWKAYKDKQTEFVWNELNIIEYTNKDMINFCFHSLEDIASKWIDEIKGLDPKWIGLSIYSSRISSKITESICKILRRELPNIKIVAGGHGISLPKTSWGAILLKRKLVDYFIKGEGEISIVSLLKNETGISGLNGAPVEQINDLDSIPFPDYSDTDPGLYPQKKLYIITSRGCVRRCNFCDNYFKNIRFRSPDNIIEELVDITKKYKIRDFFFADSLSNGNPKQLKGIATNIIKYNKEGLLPKIIWGCSVCCLPMKAEVYRDIKEAGCVVMNVGIESGSDKVRKEMNKSTKDEDIYFMIEQCRKNRINLVINLIVGYYTETDKDFQHTLDMITNISYCLKDIKLEINVGPTFKINNIKEWEHLGLKLDRYSQWYYKENTYPSRAKRWLKLVDHCEKLKFTVIVHQKKLILEKLKKYENAK